MERNIAHFLQELYVNFSSFGKDVCMYTYACEIVLSVDTEVVTIFCVI